MAQSTREGVCLDYTTTSAITNGALLILGDTPAVALNTKAAGSGTISVATEGVFTLVRKASAGNVGLGNKCYYVATGGVNTITSATTTGTDTVVGVYAAATTTDATTCSVKLLGGPVTTE